MVGMLNEAADAAEIDGWEAITVTEMKSTDGVNGYFIRARLDTSANHGAALGKSGCILVRRLRFAFNLRIGGPLEIPESSADLSALSNFGRLPPP